MKLSRRLSMIASMVRRCHSVADIGSDHAYIPCALVLNNQCAFAIAADIAKGPLEQAINNIEKYELNDKVIPVLSDGLINVEPTDCIVIAGMGVITAIEIMEAQLDKIKMAKQVVVQVNKDPMTLRHWINNHHFTIDDEACIYEDHDYVAISFNAHSSSTYTSQQCYLGPILQSKNDDNVRLYYHHLFEMNTYLLDKVKDTNKRQRIQCQLDWLKQLL